MARLTAEHPAVRPSLPSVQNGVQCFSLWYSRSTSSCVDRSRGLLGCYISEEIVILKPLGSVTSNAREFHSVSCGSASSFTPAALARDAI